MRKDFFEIYTKLGHAPSQRFAIPGLKAAAIRSLLCRQYWTDCRLWECRWHSLAFCNWEFSGQF